ncbi:hypothetical protein PLIIFM63780_003848 [Purpureocillium lilacinum]|nr:hypothetical protein PLIIFM63780_003848 [Purpureocillium lilacinum]
MVKFVASLLTAALIGRGTASPAVEQPSAAAASGASCCKALTDALGSKVASKCSPGYTKSIQSYWAVQETQISPTCVLLATSADDVSKALNVLVPSSCRFAVRGGGHGPIPGIANIQDGVTIDLSALREITPNQDKSLVALGPGLNWASVYSKLDSLGVSVPGGRDGPVGVGGSTTGGGFGYFATKAGFTAENVASYQVVLANGTITTASSTENRALWMSLKGGSSNFGIVTRFTIRTFPLGKIWGGDAYYSVASLDAHIKALYDFTADPNYDVDAGYFLNYAYTAASGAILTNRVAYAKPLVNPPAFRGITSVPGQMQNTTKVLSLAEFSNQALSKTPAGYQQLTWSVTFNNNVAMLKDVWTAFNASIATVRGVQNVTWSLTLEPIVPAIALQTKAKGGNVLGLDNIPSEGLILCLLSATWVSSNDSPRMNAASDLLLSGIIQLAKRRGVYHRYVDMNHAIKSQDPIEGFGSENTAFLRKTAQQYDPNGVFQTLMPGGFKL